MKEDPDRYLFQISLYADDVPVYLHEWHYAESAPSEDIDERIRKIETTHT